MLIIYKKNFYLKLVLINLGEVRRSISNLSNPVHNALLAFEIRINIIMMRFGMDAFIAGIYGINLYVEQIKQEFISIPRIKLSNLVRHI
jgi:hypothetical protein